MQMEAEDIWTAVIGRPDDRLLRWLEHCGARPRLYEHAYEPSIARNIAIRQFLASDNPAIAMFDGDQIPCDDTLLYHETTPGLVYCGYPSRNTPGQGHFGDGDFAAGCFRATREVLLDMTDVLVEINRSLAAIDLPLSRSLELGWFQRPVRDLGGTDVYCSCDWFNALAQRAGHKPRMVGTIGHALKTDQVLWLKPEFIAFASGRRFAEFRQLPPEVE